MNTTTLARLGVPKAEALDSGGLERSGARVPGPPELREEERMGLSLAIALGLVAGLLLMGMSTDPVSNGLAWGAVLLSPLAAGGALLRLIRARLFSRWPGVFASLDPGRTRRLALRRR